MTTFAYARYTGYRFPAEIIAHAVWPYLRFPLGCVWRCPYARRAVSFLVLRMD
jgi:hypothetical protein